MMSGHDLANLESNFDTISVSDSDFIESTERLKRHISLDHEETNAVVDICKDLNIQVEKQSNKLSVNGESDADELEESCEEEADDMEQLLIKQERKHVYVMSQAGKPIYSRHGSEDKLATLMGVMQALISVVQDNGDSLRCIEGGAHRFYFMSKPPLILVCVSCKRESVEQLELQLTYVYNQIISVLTVTRLKKLFEKRQNYDLRRFLSGAEKFIDSLVDTLDTDIGYYTNSVRCLPLASNVRDSISLSIEQTCKKIKNLVFAILLAGNRLVTLVRMKRFNLEPSDLHLIINLVSTSESFKTAESWSPICLPKFDANGFLHGHISYISESCDVCLLLLTVDGDSFFTLAQAKQTIVERLVKLKAIEALESATAEKGYTASETGIVNLRHFTYKNKTISQHTCSAMAAPYNTAAERERLFGLHLFINHRMQLTSRPLRILYYTGQTETVLGWVTSTFELYSMFEPLVTKPAAIKAVTELLKWINSQSDRLFMLEQTYL